MIEKHIRLKLKKMSKFSKCGILKIVGKVIKVKYFLPIDEMSTTVENKKGKLIQKRRYIFAQSFLLIVKGGIKFISAFDIHFSIYTVRFFVERNLDDPEQNNDTIDVYLTLHWENLS